MRFSYSNSNIIRCNGFLIEGLNDGDTKLFIYRVGDNNPCATMDFSVIKRNRITSLTIMDKDIIIGEGDSFKIELDYHPSDADNVDRITWESKNPSVATVSSQGVLRGVSRGHCQILCLAEQISVTCDCEVKPHLQKIIPEFYEIDMIYEGSCKKINFRLYPEDCIDAEIIISSIDASVANVKSGQISPVGIGFTRIIIQNRQETVRTEIKVNVMTEKDYHRLQRQKEKERDREAGKQSWFSKLFG